MKKIMQFKDKIVFVTFCAYILLSTFTNTAWYVFSEEIIIYNLLKLIRYVCYLIFVIVIAVNLKQKKYSKEAIIYFVILLALSFIGIFTGKDKSLFLTILFYGFVFGLNSEKLIGYAFLMQGSLLAVTIGSSFLGLADNSILDSERVRYSLGFSWSTFAPALYLFVALQYIFIRKGKITIFECALMEVFNIVLYKYTDTKMSFGLLSVVLVTLLGCLLCERLKNTIREGIRKGHKLIVLIPVAGAVFACWMPLYSADSKLWIVLNNVLSNRLLQCKNAIVEYGFSLFGRYIESETFSVAHPGISELTCFIDSGYLHYGMKYGMIALALLIALYSISIWKAYMRHDYLMVVIFIIVALFCVEDLYLVHPFNIFTIYAFCDEDCFSDEKILKKAAESIDQIKTVLKENVPQIR